MRTILQNKSFADSDFLGIFSPGFRAKTGFSGAKAHDLVAQSGSEVVGFPPLFPEIARHQNIFLQGEFRQPGMLGACQDAFETIGLGPDLKNLWADQTRSIFSNYFVARYGFWREWFELSEQIFAICERGDTPLAARLTAFVQHRDVKDRYQMKIFVVERLVNAMLEARNINADARFNFPFQRDLYNESGARRGKTPVDYGVFLLLDALRADHVQMELSERVKMLEKQRCRAGCVNPTRSKRQYVKTRQHGFLNLYRHHHSKNRALS
jgi:hypothetical protein